MSYIGNIFWTVLGIEVKEHDLIIMSAVHPKIKTCHHLLSIVQKKYKSVLVPKGYILIAKRYKKYLFFEKVSPL